MKQKKNKILFFIITCLLLNNNALLLAQTPSNDYNWQLQWEDEFNDSTLPKWWKSNLSDHNGEPQLYIDDNISVSNGNRVIEINNNDTVFNNVTKHYTSGLIKSRKNYHTKFGYIEGRIKLPYKRGLWPAFWTWRGDMQNYSNDAEIDIFEMIGEKYPVNSITTNVHTCYRNVETYPNANDDPCKKLNMFQLNTFLNFSYTDWHTYAVEWNADKITWYLDGTSFRTIINDNLNNNINTVNSIIDSAQIILNVAVWKDDYGIYLSPTYPPFQEYMYVDYVKVYQLTCDKDAVVNEISNYNTFNYGVKKSISLSGVSSLVSGQNVSLRATDFIELKNGFEVPLGAELYLDINTCE